MTLVLCRETGGRAAAAGRGPSPEDLIALLFPRGLHIVNVLQLQVDRVPAIRVSARLSVVVVAWYPDVEEARRLRGGEDGEDRPGGSPVGEEMALIVVSPGVVAKRVVACCARSKGEVVAGRREPARLVHG